MAIKSDPGLPPKRTTRRPHPASSCRSTQTIFLKSPAADSRKSCCSFGAARRRTEPQYLLKLFETSHFGVELTSKKDAFFTFLDLRVKHETEERTSLRCQYVMYNTILNIFRFLGRNKKKQKQPKQEVMTTQPAQHLSAIDVFQYIRKRPTN